jgi:CRISPR system Cascade subunit CasA
MNLIHDPWLPIRRRSGSEQRIAPWQVTERLADDPVVAPASPRADFDGALVQFLIGLLQTALAPARAREWRRRFDEPPDPEALRRALEPLAYAFELFGDGARFLQDLTLERESPGEEAVEHLLIEAPGENTLRLGKDHFVKAGQVGCLCPACAAAVLLTLQINAPSGGQGHRTGVRGGGPLTTLVFHPENLWSTLWLNVLETDLLPPGHPDRGRPEDRFPWLAPTRTSEKGTGRTTTREDVDPLQVYWGMPRRIRLVADDGAATCDLCGGTARPPVRRYRVQNLGINYTGPWEHPLSPHRIDPTGLPLPLHGSPAGLAYRQWLGLVQSHDEERLHPARVVVELQQRQDRRGRAEYLLWAFGYDMDNMKARAWVEGTMPLLLVDPELREEYERQTARLVLGARQAERALVYAAKEAVTGRPKDMAGDPGDLGVRFWQETEAPFYDHLRQLREGLGAGSDPAPTRASWHRYLARAAQQGFAGFCGDGFGAATDPRRVALAWKSLQKSLYGAKMRELLGPA